MAKIDEMQDAGEAKNIKKALIEEANIVQKYLDVAGVIFVVIGADQRIRLINKKGCAVLNCEGEEIIGLNWFDTFIPERIRGELKGVFEKLTGGELASVEYYENPVLTRNGEERIIAWHNTLLTDEHGKIYATLSSGEDITDRKKSEEAALKAEAKFHTLFDSFPDAIFIVDMEGRFLDVNQAACERLGYSREELLQMGPADIDAPEYAAKVPEWIKALLEQGRLVFETAHVSRDGIVIPIEMSDRVIEYDGNPAIIGIGRDITERKKAEECLEEQRHELEIIIDSSPIIIFYKDKGGRFLRVNKAFAEALQIPKEQFSGKTVFDLYSANIAQGMTNDDREVFESGCPKINIVEQYESASGIRWVQTDKIPIFSADGITTGLVGFAQDITERKKAEDNLRESEKTMKAIMNATTDAIFLIDTAGNILAFNETTTLRLGKGKDEIIGSCIYDYLPPDKARSRRGYVNEAVSTGKTVSFEDERNGEWIDHSIYPIFDEQGKITKVAIYGRYVTERKKAESEVRENELRYRSLFNRENSAVMIFDGETLQFEDVNQKALSVFGYTKEEFLNLKVLDISAEKEKTTVAVQKVKDESMEYRYVPLRHFLKKDGTVFPGEIFPGTFMLKDRKKIIGVVNDITERKKAEDKLKEAYHELEAAQNAGLNIMEDLERERGRLESSLEEREVLLRELHHRVKNNMQIMSSLMRLQARTITDSPYSGMFKDALNRITAMSLVHEKLYGSEDLGRIGFRDYIRNLAEDLFQTYDIAEGRISLKTDVEAPDIDIDKAIPLGLIINELITNAIKYAFPGDRDGEIIITIRPVSENELELLVADNGIGMPGKLDVRDTKTLGLQLVTTLAEDQLKGSIEINRDKGTEVRIKFKI